MSVRLVVGRAGSGKTRRCLEAIRARLRESPAAGPRLLLIVPEQASFQMERALIETEDLSGFTRCEVLSFQRLAYRIFSESGTDPKRGDQTIGSLGRIMVLRRLIRRERHHLTLLGRVGDKPGLVKQVATALDELMRQEITPDQLAELAAKDRPERPLESAKLADLTRLYQSYLDYLITDPAILQPAPGGLNLTEGLAGAGRLDPAQYLSLAAERLAGCSCFDGAEVWVDGFAGFTSQEYHLLAEVARRAGGVEITMLVDPHASAIEAERLPAFTQSLFARTERTVVTVRRELGARGIRIDAPVRLERTHFASRELEELERWFFRDDSPRGAGQSPSHGGQSPAYDAAGGMRAPREGGQCPPYDAAGGTPAPRAGETPAPRTAVCVCELPDRRAEVSAAIGEIQRLAREGGLRYRDIAIIVRDLGPYHDLVASLMRAAGIPCFIDRRQPTTHHPLIELLRGLLAVACDDCRFESVRALLKTGLLPIAPDEADLLENYLLASGVQGWSSWQKEWRYTRAFRTGADGAMSAFHQDCLAHVNRTRATCVEVLGPWFASAQAGNRARGLAWATALYQCLQRSGVPARIASWAADADEDGRADEADAHRQVWNDFVELIDEFVAALGDEELSVGEFRETLEAGLAEFTLGLAPPTLDQVLVGAIERSRHPSVRAALVLGFDESLFPKRRSEDPLLGDAEREALEEAGLEIGPSRRRQLLDERMLVYIALTRANEQLWISYPRADADGKPLQPSPYLRDVVAALPGLQVEKVSEPVAQREPSLITSVPELGGRLAGELRYRSSLDAEIQPERRREWNGLYERATAKSDWSATLGRCLAGLTYRNEAMLTADTISRLVEDPFVASVSRLEKFAACPFAHFAEYTLGLEPRPEADMADVDLGKLCHAVLEKFVKSLVEDGRALSELEDDQIAERVDRLAAEVVPQLAGEMVVGEARNAYLLDRSRGHLARVARWQRDAARVGRFRPGWVEYPFGYTDDQRLVLTTPAGRTVYLRGRIDRVDVADLGDELVGLVIDYKRTTDRRLDLTQVYHGLTLQLVGYLLALQQGGHSLAGRPIRPVAALYLPLLEPFRSVKHPKEEKGSSYRMRGIVDASALDVLDRSVQPGAASSYLSARLTKEGRPDSRCDLSERRQLHEIIGFVGKRMGELADGMIDGKIEIMPYRLNRKTPCSFCEYRAVCRYEILLQAPRNLEGMKRSEAMERMTQTRE